ncbi:MAG TPA: NAD(P)/FAD-dependent oxidoreductase [Rhizomicrobium sp.]|nr:NAD(P)/FAD-dependent oxidoreductase [Rhizomicrobium sp.]
MSDTFRTDAVVIGAGVIGLAIARALAQAGREVVILEKNARIGEETSARNSEVIHAGIYYSSGSLKARLCVEGRDRLYAFCESRKIAHKKLGKLIVATRDGQDEQLGHLFRQARENGVSDLKPISRAEIAALEPELSTCGGLFSPSTGIIDSHHYMLTLLGEAEAAGASLVRNAEVTAVAGNSEGFRLTVRNAGEAITLRARILVNSAGLWAPKIAGMVEGLAARFVPETYLAKGNYVTLVTRNPFRHLVYPVPEPGGLGVHLTIDMAGAARFGPNVEWLSIHDPAAIDYSVSPALTEIFAPRIAEYWPRVTPAMLAPGYSGVRPKVGGPKNPNADFRIEGPDTHGVGGLVNLFGIESPGLTASLAIAERVKTLVTHA